MELLRARGESVRGSWSSPFHPQGLPHLRGCGAGSPTRLPRSPAAAHPARLHARSKVEGEAPSRCSRDPVGRGHRALLPRGSGAARSPLCNPAAEGGIGRFPPTPAPGGGAQDLAARVSCPGARHGAIPGSGLDASGHRLRSGPVARSGRGWSRRGLVPEGDRSRARSRPPAGPAAASRRPAAPAPPPMGPWEGPRILQAGSGTAGIRRAPGPARPLLPGFPAHLRHIGTFRANEQRRAQSPDGAPEPIAAAAAAAAAVRPAPARRRRRLGPL